jgi:hypothetical protein
LVGLAKAIQRFSLCQAVSIREVHDDIWLVSFVNYDLEYFDLERIRSAQKCHPCDRYVL